MAMKVLCNTVQEGTGNVDLFQVAQEIGSAAAEKVEHFHQLLVKRPTDVGRDQLLAIDQDRSNGFVFHRFPLVSTAEIQCTKFN